VIERKYFKFSILMISQEIFETTTGHTTHVLHAKSCLRFTLGVDLQLQLQLQHESLKLMLKLKIDSEEKSETEFKKFVKFRVELFTSISLLGTA
jgi:hypothetical protein